MKSLAVRLAIALTTFVVGVSLTALLLVRRDARVPAGESPKPQAVELKSSCGAGGGSRGRREETLEERAVRLAEEFVARNGYTDLPPERDRLSYESVEWESNVDEMLKHRHDTLERKAYGIYYGGRGREKGWTVAFKPRPRVRLGGKTEEARAAEWGRAVTMDENFEHLRVEHKDFHLGSVQKRF